MRQIFLAGGALSYVGPAAWSIAPTGGPAIGDLLRAGYPGLGFLFQPGSLPLLPVAATIAAMAPMFALALPFSPPPEHGLLASAGWLRRHGHQSLKKMGKDLGSIVVKGNRFETDYGMGAVWEMPTVNLRLADGAAVETSQDLWGEFLNGLTAAVETSTIATRIDPASLIGQIERYSPMKLNKTAHNNALAIAAWLRNSVQSRHLIERRHFLTMTAEDEATFDDSLIEIEDGLGELGFRTDLIQRLEGDELRHVIQRTWSSKTSTTKTLRPIDDLFVASDCLYSDGEWHIVMALGKWQRIIRDNALAALIDGAYEVDVIQHIVPIEADSILDTLERRCDAMKATSPNRKRSLAIDDLEAFIGSLESGEESPFEVSIYLHVHGADKKQVKQDARSVIKRVRRTGARAHSLRWEQAQALQAAAPIGINQLDRRAHRVDTSSVKRQYPWSASSMWMEGAVPLGETIDSRRPVGWSPWARPMIANGLLAGYMVSGGGKGFTWKVWSSRALFAGVTQEFFGFDQAAEDDKMGEYGRWAEYCGIEYRHVTSVADFPAALADLDNYRWLGPGIEWNIAKLPLVDRPRFMAEVKDALFKRSAQHPARRQWAVDELWSFVKISTDMGIDPHWIAMCLAAIEDLVRTGRHLQLGGAFWTQRAKDSIDVPLMQILLGMASTQIFGMQTSSEISDIAPRLHWTPADVSAIKKFSPGQMIVQAGPWKVACRVTASDAEYAMANTDGRPSRLATTPSSEELDDDA